MRNGITATVLGIGILAFGNSMVRAQEPLRAGPQAESRREVLQEVGGTRALLQITSEAGVCYWSITGDDDLVRLPVKDEPFSSILLSARFENEQLHLSLAGERAPLDTTSLGQVALGLRDGLPVKMESFQGQKSSSRGGWQLRVIPPHTKVDTSNCCSCGITKLTCCPNANYCIGCGVCGSCCG